MNELARGIYAIGGLRMGRSYLVEDHDGLSLIDTSSAGALGGILDAISSLGRRIDELHTIVATHYHHDHTGNVAALVERSGATLLAHEVEAPYIDGRMAWREVQGPLAALTPKVSKLHYTLSVARELRTGERLPIAGGLDVVHTPGHTPGHISLLAPERRVLFSGDAFMHPMGFMLPMRMASHDMERAKQSVRALSQLDFDIALPGHGSPIIGQANEKLADWVRRWL